MGAEQLLFLQKLLLLYLGTRLQNTTRSQTHTIETFGTSHLFFHCSLFKGSSISRGCRPNPGSCSTAWVICVTQPAPTNIRLFPAGEGCRVLRDVPRGKEGCALRLAWSQPKKEALNGFSTHSQVHHSTRVKTRQTLYACMHIPQSQNNMTCLLMLQELIANLIGV